MVRPTAQLLFLLFDDLPTGICRCFLIVKWLDSSCTNGKSKLSLLDQPQILVHLWDFVLLERMQYKCEDNGSSTCDRSCFVFQLASYLDIVLVDDSLSFLYL